jgi:glycerol-3-phosphate cytidylyltransferase
MIVYTGGSFDLFHAGHAEFLERLSRVGGVTVSLNTDEFITQFKGRPPVNNYHERETVLLACRFVSAVVLNLKGADSKPAILKVGPDIVAIGSDWHDRDYLAQMQFDWSWLHARGIALLYVPRVTPVSSTAIKERLR